MSNLKYIVGGQERPLSEFGDNMKTGVRKLVEASTIKRIEAARCPVHGGGPTNVQVTIDGGQVRWTFEKCCEELEKAAAAMFTGEQEKD